MVFEQIHIPGPDCRHAESKTIGPVIDDDGLHYVFKRPWNTAENNERRYQIEMVKLNFQFIYQMLNELMEPLMPFCSGHCRCIPSSPGTCGQ